MADTPVPAGPARPTVAVVGGGVTGLAAAWELSGGAGGPDASTPHVVVVEAGERLGGKLRSEPFGPGGVDVGPDGFLGRRPEAADLCREIGLGDDLVPIGASGAAVWVGGRRRTLPGSLAVGEPTRFLPTARSRVLGPWGSARLALDVLLPRRDLRGPLGDRAVGPLVAHKLGRRVVERLVDPLIGGIYAGGVDDMSAAAVYPLLLAVAQRRGGFMRSLRRATAVAQATGTAAGTPEGVAGSAGAAPPAFWSLRGGLGALGERMRGALASRDVAVRTGCRVDGLEREPGTAAWVLRTAGGPVRADRVVLALPAGPAADLLAPHDPETATLLRGIDYSTVATVTFAYPEGAVPDGLAGTGLLVPRAATLPRSLVSGPFLVTACTYLTIKWPHLSRPGEVLLRASVGRFGDDRPVGLAEDELVARVAGELGVLLGVEGEATASMVTHWPDALPQYRVHHLLRVTGIESAVRRLGGLAVAGAAYRGVGIPACVASGRAAAREVLSGAGDGGRAR
ncbi:MAG: protoporphyrinogen oxidase [Acidimicrobiales bacterium]